MTGKYTPLEYHLRDLPACQEEVTEIVGATHEAYASMLLLYL